MTIDLQLSLLNLEGGGLQPDGSYDFDGLLRAFAEPPAPHLLMICECKFWHARGKTPFRTAIRQLSTLTGRHYVGELFTGPLGTAVIYDPTVLHLDAGEEPDFPDKRNLARFSLYNAPDFRFWAFVEHWPYHDGDQRLARAKLLARYGTATTPTLLAGDNNGSGTGPHLPVVDWQTIPIATRDYKGQFTDGVWGPDTRAVDRLIGRWDNRTGRRIDGAGFHQVAELDPDAPDPLPPTVNGGSGLHIDHILINDAFLNHARVVAGSYQVHIPPAQDPARWPSDHRRISCTLRLQIPAPAIASRPDVTSATTSTQRK
ncbi:hypothetical protein DMB66_59710 [Actinoplanes sp. ATCC 53533]|uniref:endonuclease/exonuclease/phosphatase family protein n=1 Tax=Actinoplanes sp. ATCC 53533 TaxID=1288362 RepID=UPI000F7A2492|nr:endonuclease/exonuclease/phosphatase family protein [Actinoplanes sp. ATCC 53533]RSM37148.1 hypothetical protein DMB66_59710 [Actinoplanes sp. ATCC 53533]